MIMLKNVLLVIGLLLWGASAYAALDGKQLYDRHCVTCHRATGEGGLGLPLKKSKFAAMPDSYLSKTIRHGRPGRVMPAFTTLSDAQVNAIVKYLREWSGASAAPESELVVTGDVEHGKQLYEGYCANCHGVDGKGIGKGTGKSYSRERDFDVVPPAISNPGFLASAPDAMLVDIIKNGRKGSLMAAFGKLGLSDQDIADTVVYLRSIESATQATEPHEQELYPEPTIIVDSPDDFDTTVSNLKQAISGHNFRIFPDRYIEQGLRPEWEVNKKQLTIRFCNFNRLYDMLKVDPRVGVGLPCRMTVVEREDGQVQIISMNMALIARLFNNDQLASYGQEMNNMQLEIIEEVTF